MRRWEHQQRFDIFNARANFVALEAMHILIHHMENDGWEMVSIDRDCSWWKREVVDEKTGGIEQ